MANGERFYAACSSMLSGAWVRYVEAWGHWYIWDGTRWKRDEVGWIYQIGHSVVRKIWEEAQSEEDDSLRNELLSWAERSEMLPRLEAMLRLARTSEGIAEPPEVWDRDPWLLCCPNGTVDLRDGCIRASKPADLMTKIVGTEYDADAPCERWERFILEIMGGREDLAGFLRRAVGYSLTGDARERCIFFLYGNGKNGKSTFLEVVRSVLGDYAQKTRIETVLARSQDGIPNDLARLRGSRFVYAAESGEGRRLDEARVKEITGREHISARFLYGEYFEFVPEFKLWVGTNHKPDVRGSDQAIWDRLVLVPFDVRFGEPDGPEDDKELQVALERERPGILRWAVEGCLEWQRHGLSVPRPSTRALQDYMVEQDSVSRWVEDVCIVESEVSCSASRLYSVYRESSLKLGIEPLTQQAFGRRLRALGFEKRRMTRGLRYQGIALRNAVGFYEPETEEHWEGS